MKVICVENGKLFQRRLREEVRSIVPDAEIYTFSNPEQALNQAKAVGCDILVTEIDVGWTDTGGILLARYLKDVNPKAKIIFVTAFMKFELKPLLRHVEFDACIQKPYLFEEFETEFRKLGAVSKKSGEGVFNHEKAEQSVSCAHPCIEPCRSTRAGGGKPHGGRLRFLRKSRRGDPDAL